MLYMPNLKISSFLGIQELNMATITEEFRTLAKDLSELYQKRKDLAKDIIFKEDKLRKLGLMLEFVDNLEDKLTDSSVEL